MNYILCIIVVLLYFFVSIPFIYLQFYIYIHLHPFFTSILYICINILFAVGTRSWKHFVQVPPPPNIF